tara:strand:+ start:214 stop:807 length:594 start_codon:yes stop_codon:yes gene_type:complete
MELKLRKIAGLVAGLTAATGLILLVTRGGLIAWAALFIGALLLTKIWLKPSKYDLAMSSVVAIVLVSSWIGTFYYVISTFESGEVVELQIDTENGLHIARVWVLDIGAHPIVYYDTEPAVVESLLAGTPIQLTRSGETSTRIPEATLFDELPEDEANQIFEVMGDKYAERNEAVEVFYSMLGSPRNRIDVVARLKNN